MKSLRSGPGNGGSLYPRLEDVTNRHLVTRTGRAQHHLSLFTLYHHTQAGFMMPPQYGASKLSANLKEIVRISLLRLRPVPVTSIAADCGPGLVTTVHGRLVVHSSWYSIPVMDPLRERSENPVPYNRRPPTPAYITICGRMQMDRGSLMHHSQSLKIVQK
ncbi:hypothetical protein CBL_07533 [Carabus blaptoides fortunei]